MPAPSPRWRARAAQAREEWRLLRQAQATTGFRAGAVQRLRTLLGVDDVADRATVDRLGATLAQAVGDLVGVDRKVSVTALHEQVWATMTWLELVAPVHDVLVSVVMATRDRPALLARAVESVLNQTHERFELIVIDDSTDGSAKETLAGFADPRVRPLQTAGLGPAGARNAGLDAATGDIVVHVDDDNVMHPGWLRAVAWAFDRWPETDTVYGARIFERSDLMVGDGRDVPVVELEPWDRDRLEDNNFIDLNVLAHRRVLREARFDESVLIAADWDLALRLTQTKAPRVLPHIACAYTTAAPDRLSDVADHASRLELVRAINRDRAPLRVLLVASQFPLLSETYIDEDRRALIDAGFDVAVYRDFPTIAPSPGIPLSFTDLDDALQNHRPDVVLMHWADFALGFAERLSALGLPFAVRVHSFDFSPKRVRALAAHPLCVAVWVHAHRTQGLEEIALPYRPFIWPPPPPPSPGLRRDLVLSTSAGLPKKDWPTLLTALATLTASGVEARAVAGFSYGLEHLPSELARLLGTFPHAPLLQLNVPRSDVFRLLGRTAVLVYTLAPGQTFGAPMSIIEGLCAGASVVVPDILEADAVAGPHARRYRTADDIVAHARTVLAGGADIAAEQRANREFGLRTYADPALRTQFADELYRAMASYDAARR